MPSHNSRRRHSKQPSTASSKKSAPSVISTTSLESASNNATVNKYSIFPSSLRPSKRPDAKKVETDTPELCHHMPKSINDPNRENVDVFAYMMEEGEEDEEEEEQYESGAMEEKAAEQHAEAAQAGLSSSSSSAGLAEVSPKSPRYSDLEVRAIQDGVPRIWARASLHSDSGISVRSSSPDQDSPIMQHKLPTVFDESLTEAITEVDGHQDYSGGYGLEISSDPVDPCSAFDHKHWPSMETNHNFGPEAYYASPPSRLSQAVHNDSSQMPDLCPMPVGQLMKQVPRPERPQARRISNSGYEFLASNIDSRDDALLRPIYRKFEMLNNRMLLYLQDEIAEMEDQLRELDDAIATEQESSGCLGPASRRAEAKLPSQLHWHRIDLLHRSFAKVEQYNRALTSYSNLTRSLSPAPPTSIIAYRAWLADHAPIVSSETSFLDDPSDLLSIATPPITPTPNLPTTGFPPTTTTTPNHRSGSALETPIIVVAFGLLSTIIVFRIVPQILARLVISALVGVAALCTLSPEVMRDVRGVREWGRAIATYAGIMVILAIVS